MTEQFKILLKRISRNADGDTMIQMWKRGVKYKRNYGIKLPVLKAIASEFKADQDFADELWASNIREMRIIAGFLQPAELLSFEKLSVWAKDFNNPEIVEQTCINLFSKSELAYLGCSSWFSEPESGEYAKMAAFVLASLLIQKNLKSDNQFIDLVLDECIKCSQSDSLHIKNGIVRAIVAIGKLSKQYNEKSIKVVNEIGQQSTQNSNFIVEGALFQLEFFAESL